MLTFHLYNILYIYNVTQQSVEYLLLCTIRTCCAFIYMIFTICGVFAFAIFNGDIHKVQIGFLSYSVQGLKITNAYVYK